MLGERSSVFKSIFLNPLVWTGFILTFFTLEYNRDDVFSVFLAPETYRNLAIFSTVYVCLLERHCIDGGKHLDLGQTLSAIIVAMLSVLIIWFSSVFAITYYQSSGENYSELVRQHYKNDGGASSQMASPASPMEKALENVKIEPGQKYKITPNDDGSFTVEIQ